MPKAIHRLSNKNEETRTATCAKCGQVAIVKTKDRSWTCINSKRESNRKNKFKTKYGHMQKIGEKPKACQICGKKKRLCLDHDHNTGAFRGWLCHNCNLVLGNAYDDPTTLQKAIGYLHATLARTAQ